MAALPFQKIAAREGQAPRARRCHALCFDKYCHSMASLREEVPMMASMNISLPDAMKDWVETQTSSGRYDNASEYMRDLIRHDQDRAQRIAAMQSLVDEAMASPDSTRSLAEIRQIARQKAGVDDTV
jgi:antitoxin ParD1/3/4